MANTPGGVPGITLAGWTLRNFDLESLEALVTSTRPRVVEISKDQLSDAVSLKSLEQTLRRISSATGANLAFAGTTDLVGMAGLPWERYRQYIAVQIAQARFLGCSAFRPLLGGSGSSEAGVETLVRRVLAVCDDAAPMSVCIEVHDGPERDPVILEALLARTPIRIVLDIQNVLHAGYTFQQLCALLPLDRIAYVHQRNLPGAWTEDEQALADEARWHALLPDTPFLWEPKTVDDPARIEDLFDEYRRSH